MSIKILSFGEVLWDIIDDKYNIGGAPLNFAGHLSRLGAESYILSSVGKDKLGEEALEFLKSCHIDCSLIDMTDKPTGTVIVTLSKGIPDYNIVKGAAWDYISLTDDSKRKLKEISWDVLYLGSLAQRSDMSRKAIGWILKNINCKDVFFDVNLRQKWYNREIIAETMKFTTILKLNDEEVPVVSSLLFKKKYSPEQLARQLIDNYKLSIVIVTCGELGALFFDKHREYVLKPDPLEVLDTVGAGDSFSAAFVYSYLKTGDIDRAGKLALDVASYVVSKEGALPDYSETFKQKIGFHLK
ncbi:MAG: carbohydrate kinase [Spirochaetaceae bacterium]|nr:carbohydrate kinase [Spirochaetaceae bacterium]